MTANATSTQIVGNTSSGFDEVRDLSPFVIFSLVMHIIITLSSLWILLSVVEYGRRNKTLTWKTERGKLYVVCLAAIAVGEFRFITDLSMFGVDLDKCELLGDLSYVTAGLSVLGVYLFQWFRQHTFYLNDVIRVLIPRWAHITSYVCLITIIITDLGLAVNYIYPDSHSSNRFGCTFRDLSELHSFYEIRGFVLPLIFATEQIALMALFIFPIVRLKMNQDSGQNTTKDRHKEDEASHLIKRSIICFVCIVITDVVSGILTTVGFVDLVVFNRAITNTDILINHICTVLGFQNYKEIFGVLFHLNVVPNTAVNASNSFSTFQGDEILETTA